MRYLPEAMSYPLEDAAKVLSMLRQEAGLSCRGLARKLKISPSSISQYERGERKIPYNILEQTAALSGREIKLLITRKDERLW